MTKILLVEDDNNLREIYGARLEAEGFDIAYAQDGEEALSVAVKEKPDLIISDVMMPKISGFDMLDILRNTPETTDTKVIMMTALSQLEDKERADKLGADRYLVKSQVTLEDVVNTVHDILKDNVDTNEQEIIAATAPEQTPTTQVQPQTTEPSQESVINTIPTEQISITEQSMPPEPPLTTNDLAEQVNAALQMNQEIQQQAPQAVPVAEVPQQQYQAVAPNAISQTGITTSPEDPTPASPAVAEINAPSYQQMPVSQPTPEIITPITDPAPAQLSSVSTQTDQSVPTASTVQPQQTTIATVDPATDQADPQATIAPANEGAQQVEEQAATQSQTEVLSDQAAPDPIAYTVELPATPEVTPIAGGETTPINQMQTDEAVIETPAATTNAPEQTPAAESIETAQDASYGPNLSDILKEAEEEIKQEISISEDVSSPATTAPSIVNGGTINEVIQPKDVATDTVPPQTQDASPTPPLASPILQNATTETAIPSVTPLPTTPDTYQPQVIVPTEPLPSTPAVTSPEATDNGVQSPVIAGIHEENGKKVINPINDISSKPDLNALLAKEQATAAIPTPTIATTIQPQQTPQIETSQQSVTPTPPPSNIDNIAL